MERAAARSSQRPVLSACVPAQQLIPGNKQAPGCVEVGLDQIEFIDSVRSGVVFFGQHSSSRKRRSPPETPDRPDVPAPGIVMTGCQASVRPALEERDKHHSGGRSHERPPCRKLPPIHPHSGNPGHKLTEDRRKLRHRGIRPSDVDGLLTLGTGDTGRGHPTPAGMTDHEAHRVRSP